MVLWISPARGIPSSGFRLPDSIFRIPSSGFRLPDSIFRIHFFLINSISFQFLLPIGRKRSRVWTQGCSTATESGVESASAQRLRQVRRRCRPGTSGIQLKNLEIMQFVLEQRCVPRGALYEINNVEIWLLVIGCVVGAVGLIAALTICCLFTK